MKTQCIAALFGFLLVGHAPGKTIPNHAAADLVLGQTDFVTATLAGTPSSFSLSSPNSMVIDPVTLKVFVADVGNCRVLRYPNVSSLTNGAGAEAVFGQPRFSTKATGTDPGFSSQLRGMFFDRFGRLWVSDRDNNRVVMFEAASYRDTNAYPDRVYGQPNFTTNTSGTSAGQMNWPQGVWVDTNDRLWVADYLNNRVLRFDSISTKPNGANADGVLGQANFTTSTAGTGSSGLGGPVGVTVSATGTLFVGTDKRVMRFNSAASLGNGAGANAVLFQPDFATSTTGLSATQGNRPWGVWLTPDDTLWVLETFNRRAVRFDNASSLPNGSAANGVVGQPDFTTNTAATTDRGLKYAYYFPYVDATGSLWIPDSDNNRVLRFSPDVTKPLLAVTSTVPKSTPKKKVVIKGTASDTYGISQVTYKLNTGTTITATGTTTWQFTANLKPGKNKITINAVDSVGNKSVSKVLKIERK